MKKILNDPLTYFLAYILVGLMTFGHAYHSVPDTEPARFAGIDYTITNGIGTKVMGGMLCAMAWPLYWSVQAWQ